MKSGQGGVWLKHVLVIAELADTRHRLEPVLSPPSLERRCRPMLPIIGTEPRNVGASAFVEPIAVRSLGHLKPNTILAALDQTQPSRVADGVDSEVRI